MRQSRKIMLDANLLLLLIVGQTNAKLIEEHKRTRTFCTEDFYLLLIVLSAFDKIVVTPNILTECSNLLRHVSDSVSMTLMLVLKKFIEESLEIYVASHEAAKESEFKRLGLTDAGIIRVADQQILLLTADLDLYLAAIRRKIPAVNFNHMRAGM